MQPDEPTEEEQLEELDQDNGTPFQPANSATDVPTDHPQTDSNIDSTELYNEGVGGAAEVEDSSDRSVVADFTPPEPEEDSRS
ncbi:MAG: hypothetical protein JWN82_589 [Candidatus Saccharibacteria bacterium]|nr:hypothetical protein [Candidatus Saccharibacteria bacterium]